MSLADGVFCLAAIALLLSLMGGVHWLGERYNWSPELQRKTIHVATGLTALTFPLIFSGPWPVVLLMGLAICIMLAFRHPFLRKRVGASLHGIDRASYGEILFAAAVAFTFFRAGDEPVLYVLPILVLTLSDAAAALTGLRYGHRTFAVETGKKSVEGSAMFFLVTWILALVTLLLLTDLARPNVVLLAGIIAAFGTVVEADSWRGFDNLFVPVGIHLFLASYIDSSLADIISVAATLAVAVAAVTIAGTRIGLTAHAARAYAILVFLILSVTAIHNALLPLLAIAAHIYTQSVRQHAEAFPNLDMVASMSLIGLFWLFVGEWHGQNAINLFNLTFAALTLALLSTTQMATLPWGLVAGVALGGLVMAVSDFNVADARWYGTFWPWIVIALTMSWTVPRILAAFFRTHSILRLSGVAMGVPLALYVAALVTT